MSNGHQEKPGYAAKTEEGGNYDSEIETELGKCFPCSGSLPVAYRIHFHFAENESWNAQEWSAGKWRYDTHDH